jgi:beta-glucanase (GH16 family)
MHTKIATSRRLISVALATLLSGGAIFAAANGENDPSQLPTFAVTPPPAAAGPGPWHLIFNDEFDDNRVDAGKWITCDTGRQWDGGCAPGHAGVLAAFQPDELLEGDGVLRIRAQQRSITGTVDGATQVYEYTSGQISSREKFQFQYGYMEIRARVPQGRGMFPSFFTLPQEIRYFPPEIDVIEMLGNDTTRAYLTNHFDGQGPLSTTRTVQGVYEYQPGFHDGYHTYAADWQPGLVVWYVDGVERFRTSDRVTKEPHKLLAQLAVGIRWQDNDFVDVSTQIPSYFDIDYIRVWRRGNAPTEMFDVLDDSAKLYAQSPNLRVNLEPKKPNDTGRITRKDNQSAWSVWRLDAASVVTASVLYWPGESFKPVRFYASPDNATWAQVTPDVLSDGGDWRRREYRINMPAGSNYFKLEIPQTDQPFSIQPAAIRMTRASGVPPTATPAPRTPVPPAPAPGEMLDEVNNMTGMFNRSSRLRMETIFPERFGGDAARLIRWSLDNEWGQWRVRGGADVRVTTYHWLGEPIKHFSVVTSTNGVSLTAVSPVSVTRATSDPQWVEIEYSFKLAPEAGYMRMTWPRTNYNQSPQIGRVRTSLTNFPNLTPTAVPSATAPVVNPTPVTPQATLPANARKILLPVVGR